jgi:hypothetical protein
MPVKVFCFSTVDIITITFDKLVKTPRFRHAPAFAGAGSAKAGIQKYSKTLDSRLRGNDAKGRFKTFYEAITSDAIMISLCTLNPAKYYHHLHLMS